MAAAVPPVASTSSTTRTRSSGWMASRWISSLSAPYSSWYSSRTTAHGSLPALRTGTNDGAEPVGDGRGEDEAAGLDADDAVDAEVGERRGQLVDGPAERVGVAEQRGDVAEGDTRLSGSRGSRATSERSHAGLRSQRTSPLMNPGYRGVSASSSSGARWVREQALRRRRDDRRRRGRPLSASGAARPASGRRAGVGGTASHAAGPGDDHGRAGPRRRGDRCLAGERRASAPSASRAAARRRRSTSRPR